MMIDTSTLVKCPTHCSLGLCIDFYVPDNKEI